MFSMHSRYTRTNHSFHNYRTVNYYNPPSRMDPGGGYILYKIWNIFSRDSRRRLFFLQNLKIFLPLRAGGYIFYKILFFLALRAGILYFLQNQPPKPIVFWTFLDRFRPIRDGDAK